MATIPGIVLCMAAATVLWTLIGLSVARGVFPSSLALPLAPVIGWSVHSALALPVHMLVGMSRPVVLMQLGVSIAVAVAGLRQQQPKAVEESGLGLPAWAYSAALLLALAPAIAAFPK